MAETTLVEVAQAAGVSQSTASRVLNGSTRSVRAENAQRVREAAAQLGYSVDLRAQATARRGSSTVAIVVDALTDAVLMCAAERVRRLAEEAGLLAQITACPVASGQAADIVRLLRGQRPRSIVVLHSACTPSPAVAVELDQYERHGGVPVVLDISSPADAASPVLTDFVRLISAVEASP